MIDPNPNGSPIADLVGQILQQMAMNDNGGSRGVLPIIPLPSSNGSWAGSRYPFMGMRYPSLGAPANVGTGGYAAPSSWGPNLGK